MPTFKKDVFRERLRNLRSQHNLTQAKAADVFGTSRTCYSSWELGQSCPPMDDLFKICSIFNISSDYLLGLSDSPKPAASTPIADMMRTCPDRASDTIVIDITNLDFDLQNKATGYADSLQEIQKERNAAKTQEA